MTIEWSSLPESCTLLSLAVVAIIVVSLLKEDFFRPSTIYFLVQTIMLGLAYLKLDPLMTDFEVTTWLVWGGGSFSFLAACYLMDCMWRAKKGPPVPQKLTLHGEYDWHRHLVFSFIAFAYFMIGVVGAFSVVGNFVLLTDNPPRWLDGQNSPVLAFGDFFTANTMVIGLFAVASFKSINPVRWIRNVSKCMIILVMILGVLTFPSRSIIMMGFAMFVVLYNFLCKRINWKYLSVLFVFIMLLFIAISVVKAQFANNIFTTKFQKEIVLLPYKYIANNYWNLDYALNKRSDEPTHGFTYGMDALYGVTYLAHMGNGMKVSFGWDSPFNESVQKIRGLNTIPFLWDAYKDFGYFGVFMLPFLFGLLFTYLYHRMVFAKTPMIFLFTASFILWIIMWNFTPGYKQSMYYTWFIFFFVTCMLCKKRPQLPSDLPVSDEINPQDEGHDQIATQSE